MNAPLQVMVAILRDPSGRILITSRPKGKSHAGRWEFPGGKLEECEAPEACLRRELHEELGIVAGPMRPLVKVRHDYGDFEVHLDVREIEHFGGEPRAREGQCLKWLPADALIDEDILEADRPIIQALRLPDFCLVTPDAGAMPVRTFLQDLEATLDSGIRLVQFRSPSLDAAAFASLAHDVVSICRHHGARVLLNAPAELLESIPADGIHLSSSRLLAQRVRPITADRWLSSSCHSAMELAHAANVGVDFVMLSPVATTLSHPNAKPIGWSGLRVLTNRANMPAYALGGVVPGELARARDAGARGVAGIRAFWRGNLPN